MKVETILDELTWRGVVYDLTDGIDAAVKGGKITLYNGFDPSAASLHVGNLVPMMCVARWQRFGHSPIFVAGGGTGMIGDPGGRSEERNLLTRDEIEANLVGIQQQLASVLDFEVKSNPARLVNNADWLYDLNMMEFLRDVGKHFTVNYMIAKDSVKSRLNREGEGISYTEFSYMLLQAYDFMELFKRFGCTLQTGGSDQWGNITAGVELIRRTQGVKAFGLVYPLIVNADGSKFGKSTGGGNAWLDPKMTSPYRFYQFWLNTDDADVVNYLKIFTWLDHRRILELEHCLYNRPEQRDAQRALANEVTSMIHGPTALSKAKQASKVLFGGDLDGLDAADIADIFAEVPSGEISREAISGQGASLVDLLVNSNLARSKGDARRSISGGGIYLNNVRVEDTGRVATTVDTIEGQYLILRKGRKKYHLVKIIG